VYACSTFGQEIDWRTRRRTTAYGFLLTSSIRSSLSDLFKPGPLPYQQLHLGACLAQAPFLVVELPIRFTDLQARRTESFHAEPPVCREAVQQASETSFALLEGTQEIALITPCSELQGEKALASALIPPLLDSLLHLLSAKRFVRPPNRICKLV